MFVRLHGYVNASYILQLNNIIIANDWANALPCFNLYGHAYCQMQFEKVLKLMIRSHPTVSATWC